MNKYRLILIFLGLITFIGCASIETKREAFPKMYTEQKPLSVVVVPAINKTTAADAGELLNVTLTQPIADSGFYVMPIAIVSEIFQREGIIEGEQVVGIPVSVFKKTFGADAVLFVTINKWDTNYKVIAGNVTVGMSYVLLSTETNDVLWSYDQTIVVDTSAGNNSGIIAALIVTAVKTATTDYVPIARQVNATALMTIPYGKYHPQSGLDGDMEVVYTEAKEKALNQE